MLTSPMDTYGRILRTTAGLHGISTMLMLFASSCLLVAVQASSTPGFPVGVITPCTSLTQDFLGCAVLVDLDLRKHTEPELVERFGPPIVNLSSVHPDLRVDFQLGTDDSSVSTALRTTLNWMQGSDNGVEQVIGVAGSLFSSIVGPIASTVAVFETPQVSIGGAAASLGDRVLYPYLVRVPPVSTFRGEAVWSWMHEFQVTSTGWIYSREGFAESIWQTTADLAVASGQPGRVGGVGIPVMTEENLDMATLLAACDTIKSLGSKVVVLAVSDTGMATSVMYALEQCGMLYSSNYQILGGGGVGYVPSRELAPSLGYPIGLQNMEPGSRGPAWPGLLDMWNKMVPDDVYGQAAIERYKLDHMQVLPWEASRPMLTAADFARAPFVRCTNLFDATYTFIVAINDLLNAGTPRHEIAGPKLLEALKDVTFAGAMGEVKFNENADRFGDFFLWQAPENGASLSLGAHWRAAADTWILKDGYLVWAGGDESAIAPARLSACDPGRQWDGDAGFCTLCPRNWYSNTESGTQQGAELRCLACNAGEIGNADIGATACTACRAGTVRTLNADNCTVCPPGMFASSAGKSSCEPCAVGRFADQEGTVDCDVCGAGRSSSEYFTTMAIREVHGQSTYVYEEGSRSISACGCDAGYREEASGECVSCTTGMQCLGMDDVRILPGFYAEARSSTKELLVYRCYGQPDRCSGGRPGSTCALGREGLICSRCMDGKTPASDGTCVECGDADYVPVIAAIAIGVAALIITYYYIDQQNPAVKNTMALLCAIALGLTLTVVQQLGVVSEMSIRWEDPLKSTMDALSILTFNIDLLRPDCISAQRPIELFAAKVCIIYMGIVAVIITHICFVMCRYEFQCRARMHVLIGMIGTLFMVLYLAITATLLQPLQCLSHPSPNSHWTVRSYPSVICWESDDHAVMLVISILSFLTVPVAYLAMCVVVVMKFPAKLQEGDGRFLKAFSFLFFRFRPSCYAFVLVQTLRSFVIATILVVPDTVTQLIALQVALLCGNNATLYAMPWRVAAGNILDLLASGGMIVFVLVVSLFIDDDDKKMSSLSAFSVVLLIGLLALLPVGIGKALYSKCGRKRKPYEFFLTHHKAASGAYTRLLKMVLVEKRRLRSGAVFLDSDNLDNLDRLFDYVGNDTEKLVLLCTEQIFSRPWCVGEMCTAMLKKVDTLVVVLPGSKLPRDESDIEVCMESLVDWRVLTENGIQPKIVRAAFAWIKEQCAIKVPKSTNASVMNALVDKLMVKMSTDLTEKEMLAESTKPHDGLSAMIFDSSNLEAAATACILWKMLVPIMMASVQKIPKPLESPDLPPQVTSLVFICTNGIFENAAIVSMMGEIPQSVSSLFPIMCEPNFRFPSVLQDGGASQVLLDQVEMGHGEGWTASAVQNVDLLFKEIAITFLAQIAGDVALELAARSVAARLLVSTSCSSRKIRATANSDEQAPLANNSHSEPAAKPAGDGTTEPPLKPGADTPAVAFELEA